MIGLQLVWNVTCQMWPGSVWVAEAQLAGCRWAEPAGEFPTWSCDTAWYRTSAGDPEQAKAKLHAWIKLAVMGQARA